MIKLSTFDMCKILINKNNYVKEDMEQMIDVFTIGKSISTEEYIELQKLMNPDFEEHEDFDFESELEAIINE